MSVRLTRLDPQHYRRTPWKNGGGVTVDIADAYRPGVPDGSWDGMIWRFGRTRIERPGPFSDLAGYDRILTVIGGRGLVLEVADAPALDVRTPFRPVRFPGEAVITSRLEDGPVEVLNLMADRTRAGIELVVIEAPGARLLRPGRHVLHACAGAASLDAGHEPCALADQHSLRIESAGDVALTLHHGMIAAASIALW